MSRRPILIMMISLARPSPSRSTIPLALFSQTVTETPSISVPDPVFPIPSPNLLLVHYALLIFTIRVGHSHMTRFLCRIWTRMRMRMRRNHWVNSRVCLFYSRFATTLILCADEWSTSDDLLKVWFGPGANQDWFPYPDKAVRRS